MDAFQGEDIDWVQDSGLTYADGTFVYPLSAVERASIHAVYALYDTILGQPNGDLKPTELDAARPFLEAAYNQVQIGARLEILRERLLASAVSCPYCGFGEVRDLDHYLPKSEYGELAIYPRNLIPSCSPCNNSKRRIVPGGAAAYGPGLIHPYFETLPDEEFLLADVEFTGSTLKVSFRIDAAKVPQVANKLQFQLDRLKLNARYSKQINKFLHEQRTAMLMFSTMEPGIFSDFLRRSAINLEKSFGRNDWRAALMRALSFNAEFCAAPVRYLGSLTGEQVGVPLLPA